jgi:thioredoxin reductase
VSVAASEARRLDYNVIVVGGGPAGLSAALYLGRARRNTLLLDTGKPRNAASPSAHGVFTRDGATPGDLRAEARRQLSAYQSVASREVEAVSAAGALDGFVVRLGDGSEVRARRLLLAHGIRDELPAIEGMKEHWGRGVLHCATCHGYEVRDQALALIASCDVAMNGVATLLQVSRDLVLCTNGSSGLSAMDRRRLDEYSVRVVETKIRRVSGAPPRLVIQFDDDASLTRNAIFVRTKLALASDLPEQLGCKLDTPHRLAVSASWETTVRGVYAAGDIAAPKDQVAVAAASGAQAAIALNGDLVQADFAGTWVAPPILKTPRHA